MKKVVVAFGLAAAACGLFVGSYIGFAKLVGADMSRLALVGGLFAAPRSEVAASAASADGAAEAEPEPEPALPAELAAQLRTPVRAASIIDFFTVQAPFSTAELKGLADKLSARADELELERRALAQRTTELEQRAAKLDEDFATLLRLQQALDQQASELRAREAEVNRDAGARFESKAQFYASMGQLFEQGDAEELVERLLAFGPEEAASVLATLPPERSVELLNALRETDRWREYAEAFARRSAPPAGP